MRGAEAARGVGCEVGDDPEAGAPGLLDRQHDAQLTFAARVAVVGERDRPRDRWAFLVVGRMVVESIIDGAAHARHPTRPAIRLRLEAVDAPKCRRRCACSAAGRGAGRPVLPELELVGDEPVATPERRERHVAVAPTPEARLGFRRSRFQLLARRDRLALRRRPRTDAARARPIVPVRLGLGLRHPLDASRWRAPAGALRASGTESPRAGSHRARGPCGSRSSCRRRSPARRAREAAPPVRTAVRRAWHWPRSSRRAPARHGSRHRRTNAGTARSDRDPCRLRATGASTLSG